MAVAFQRGSTTGPNDLQISVRDMSANLIDPYRLEYAVFDFTTGIEVLQGAPVNLPVRLSMGIYYAQVLIPADANIGLWRIRWTIQETAIDPVYQSVQEFQVVGNATIASFTGDSNVDALINSLRIMLRDNNPDRNYRFRPPASDKFIQGQTQVFGFIWEDEELLEYLLMAVDDFNSRPPTTSITLGNIIVGGAEQRWRTTIIIRAAAFACFAIALNWIVDEFTYSISGISLDIDKSSKYEAVKDEFIAEYDKLVEANKASIKIIKGLRQFRYGIGITSALGPLSRPGVQSRRNLLTAGMGADF
jgi:hypothetical protein